MLIHSTTGSRRVARPTGTIALTTVFAVALGGAPAPAAASAIPDPPPPGSGVTVVAASHPSRLVQFSGDLYWTSNLVDEFGTSTATVHRTAKSGRPGQDTVLYGRRASGAVTFDAIAVAGPTQVYVVVNDFRTGTSRIERLPAGPGDVAATIAAAPRFIGQGDLVTDGAALYWADGENVRTVAIGGGTVRRLATGSAVHRLWVHAGRVYYAAGGIVLSVAKTGGAPASIATAASTVTALDVSGTLRTVVHWAEAGGAVRSRTARGGPVAVHQPAGYGNTATSVFFDGARVLWSTCPGGGQPCRVRQDPGGAIAGNRVGLAARDVQGDATATFVAVDGAIKRFRR